MSHFVIKCSRCGMELKEVHFAFCEHCRNSLLITEYKEKEFSDDWRRRKETKEGAENFTVSPRVISNTITEREIKGLLCETLNQRADYLVNNMYKR